jgi:hypothetical protein
LLFAKIFREFIKKFLITVKIMEYVINFLWDDEESVWVAESENIQGLVLESGSLDALLEKVKVAVPELLQLNTKILRNKI